MLKTIKDKPKLLFPHKIPIKQFNYNEIINDKPEKKKIKYYQK